MTANLLQEISFGQGGNDANHLGPGWSAAEDGFRWMIGKESDVWLEHAAPADMFLLRIDVTPNLIPPRVPTQRLGVVVRGQTLGRVLLERRTQLAWRLPGSLLEGAGPVRVVLQHPDAARPLDYGHPTDDRPLAVSMHRLELRAINGDPSPVTCSNGEPIDRDALVQLTGLDPARFMLQFESLGDNCEFGLVQRRCGAEPLSLLRFSNIGLADLVRAIDCGFEGLGEMDRLEFWTDDSPRREYVVRDRRFSLIFHTFMYAGEADESKLLQQQSMRLKLLRRKLLEDLANGEKIFVIKRNQPPAEAEMMALYAALRRHGAPTLLWVMPADASHAPGAVERIMPGLLKGYIDRFAPYENAHDLMFERWLRLCLNARVLVPMPEPAL